MRRLTALIPLLALAFVSACSDTTAPSSSADLTLSYAKGASNGGGVGAPHYTDGTLCTFDAGLVADDNTGAIHCDWQLGGLASNSSGIVTLVANITYLYRCNNPFILPDYNVTSVRVRADVKFYADKKGNAKGVVDATPTTSGTELLCLIGQRQNEAWDLNAAASPLALPLVTGIGSWALEGASTTPKGGPVYVYLTGGWTDPNIQL